jgi:hypothetical protein
VTTVVIYIHFMLFNIVTVTSFQEFIKIFGTIDGPMRIVKARQNNYGICFLMCGDIIEVNVWISLITLLFHFILFVSLKLYVMI